MKKNLMILVALFTMVVIPWNVKAAEGTLENVTKCETKPQKNQKITTCNVTVKNNSNVKFEGATLTIPFTPAHPTTSIKFEVETSNAKEVKSNGNEYVIQVEPIEAGKEVILGTVTYTARADLSDADCGGTFDFIYKGASEDENIVNDSEVTDTGYAVPTVALAIGAIGVVAVLATSKKKTKMYKI